MTGNDEEKQRAALAKDEFMTDMPLLEIIKRVEANSALGRSCGALVRSESGRLYEVGFREVCK